MTTRSKKNNLSESMSSRAAVRIWDDRESFIRTYSERWLANEAEDIAFLGLGSQSGTLDSLCISIHDEADRTLQTAFFTPQDQIIVSNAPNWAIDALCSHLASHEHEVLGIFAPAPTSQLMARALEKLTGMHYQLMKELYHLELHQLSTRHSTTGAFRVAENQDAEQLTAHREALQAESNTQRPFDSALSVTTDLQNDALYIWIDTDDRVVASASLYMDRTPRSAYINHVYVEPIYRRRGYASALVGELCQRVLEQGKVPRLAVDTDNHAAYQAYLKMGFMLAAQMENFRAF